MCASVEKIILEIDCYLFLCPDQELCRLSLIHHRKKLHGLLIVAGMVLCELRSLVVYLK